METLRDNILDTDMCDVVKSRAARIGEKKLFCNIYSDIKGKKTGKGCRRMQIKTI